MDGASEEFSRHRKRDAYVKNTAVFYEINRAYVPIALQGFSIQ